MSRVLLRSWNKFWQRTLQRPRHRVLRNIHSPARIRKTLRRERMRTDRNGDPFCLLTFSARERDMAEDTFVELVKVLKLRLRYTDDIGWLDPDHVAAILPSTPLAGAVKVADDVLARFPTGSWPPHCRIYCYPSTPAHRASFPTAVGKSLPIHAMEALFVDGIALSKRALDVAISATGLVAIAPLLLLIAACVKLSSPGPVLFRQLRTGRGGKPFVLYKFRTMVADAEERKADLLELNERDGPAFKIRHDPRITGIGRLLRKFCLDELPQLWNVIIGDMSLVGPRPLPCDEAARCDGWQRRRHDSTPGITCLWQARGNVETSFADWVRLDLRYVKSQSLLADARLLLKTFAVVVLGRGH